MSGAVSIPADVLDVLKQAVCDGPNLRIVEQLERELYTRTAKVLKAIGGKWNTKAQATIFNEDAAPLIADCVTTGQYVDAKKQFQFYETPAEVVQRMLDQCRYLATISESQILEPSAGQGAIAHELVSRGAIVDCVELNPAACAKLDGYRNLICGDFLKCSPNEVLRDDYDFVFMNPPFARSQDMQHVRHASQFLRPGGVLVAIMSPGYSFRQDRAAKEFRQWLMSHEFDAEDLPAGSFRSSGTMVSTVLLSIQC